MVTITTFEKRLNRVFSEIYTLNEVLERFEYLQNKKRGQAIRKATIIKAYKENRMGTILRKYDTILFNTMYNSK
jgi:hypothetical protein